MHPAKTPLIIYPMNTKLFLSAALILAAAPAMAWVEVDGGPATPRYNASDFTPTITKTFMEVGSQQMLSWQGTAGSLGALARMLVENPNAAKENPEAFARIVHEISINNSAERFAAATPKERADILRNASVRAEWIAGMDAEGFLHFCKQDYSADSAANMEKVGQYWLKNDAIYLQPEMREKIAAATEKLHRIAVAPRLAHEAWLAETPKRIANGGFDGGSTFELTETGWALADQPPSAPRYETFERAFGARLKSAASMPSGPWQTDMLRAMEQSLQREDIRALVSSEGGDPDALRAVVSAAMGGAEDATPKKLAKATAAIKEWDLNGKRPSVGALKTMVKHYDKAAMHFTGFGGDVATHWRIESVLLKGRRLEGYPSVDELLRLSREVRDSLQRRAMWALGVWAASMLGGFALTGIFGDGLIPGIILYPIMAIAIASIGYLLFLIIQRDAVPDFFAGDMARHSAQRFKAELEGRSDELE